MRFDLDVIKEEVDSFFSQDQKIKNLSLVSIKDYIELGKLEFDYALIEILKMAKKLKARSARVIKYDLF